MMNYAFIFARGGSKGLPGKNIKKLANKPLICYSIESALSARSISKVFVSTDDANIAAVAQEYGATVINRPQELAADDSPEWLAWRHAIQWVTENYGPFDRFISLPATSPLRSIDDIESAINKLEGTNADLCIAITPANRSPYFNMVTRSSEDSVKLVISPENNVTRRQDAPKVFDITTVVYVSTPEFINTNLGLFSGRVVSIEVPKNRAVDIDDIYDFQLAESIILSRNNE
ncbi:cytidylyltransferase domain-containing protein [Psychrobacter sp. ER1]|uniref:acylneuraminate cytidylyltransferase family protein n=1 Tax=Psychrobacter sp. ER1 TaxID=3406645 RepID=UPI003B42AE00